MTNIEWTNETWNPIAGCTVHSAGCTNCYAMAMAARLEAMEIAHQAAHGEPGPMQHYLGLTTKTKAGPVWTGKIGIAPDSTMLKPLRWKKPRMIFVNSMSDLFHEAVPDDVIDRVFAVMALTPQHTYQVLTKRPDRMREYLSRHDCSQPGDSITSAAFWLNSAVRGYRGMGGSAAWPLRNIWLGVSVANQADADCNIPILLETPAAKRWVSYEPAVGPVDFNPWIDQLDWVVMGGESGKGARPMHPDWARAVRDQCKRAGVPFFFKQWGEWSAVFDRDIEDPDWRNCTRWPDNIPNGQWLNFAGGCGFHGERVHYMQRIGKAKSGHLLDGVAHREFPA